mgnify:CR=1 FL=1
MTDLSGFSSRILQLLADPAGSKFPQAQITEALRMTLSDFSQANPVLASTVLTLPAASKLIDLTTLTGLLYPIKISCPYLDDSAEETETPFHFYLAGGIPTIALDSDTTPTAGDQAKIVFAKAHTIQSLDAAPDTSILTVHDSMIVVGAAAYALDLRAAQLMEAYGQRSIDITRILTLAVNYHTRWETYLATLKSYTWSLFPRGFALDQWDHRERI